MIKLEELETSIEIPKSGDYLDKYLEDTPKVIRYNDERYPKGMIEDSLCQHINRLRLYVPQLPFPKETLEKMDRIFLVHDLPETITGDVTTVIKQERDLTGKDEHEVAQEIFSPKDLEIFENFEQAGDYLKGQTITKPDNLSTITFIIDFIDGSVYFHQKVAKWIKNGNSTTPQDSALIYTFNHIISYRKKIQQLPDENTRTLCLELMQNTVDYIESLWSGYEDKIPLLVSEGINHCK